MYRALNYFGRFLVFVSAVSGYVWFSVFASLVDVLTGIASSTVRLKIYAITTKIKKYNSIIEKKRKKHGKKVLVAKTKLNIIYVLIYKTWINSYINHDDLVSANNLIREYNEMKEVLKNSKNDTENTI